MSNRVKTVKSDFICPECYNIISISRQERNQIKIGNIYVSRRFITIW